MRYSIIAALLAAAGLQAMAQPTAPRVESRPAAPVQVKEDKGKAEKPASTRERAKAAKAQRKKNQQLARQKNEPQKKAPAS